MIASATPSSWEAARDEFAGASAITAARTLNNELAFIPDLSLLRTPPRDGAWVSIATCGVNICLETSGSASIKPQTVCNQRTHSEERRAMAKKVVLITGVTRGLGR